MNILHGISLKNCVFQRFPSLGYLEGLGVVLERSWNGFRGSWGRLKACLGGLGGRVGRGFDALEPLGEPVGSGLGSLTDFSMILCGFWFILGRVLDLENDKSRALF